jgi:RNA polymerase sigma-70 factor (family 1)
MNSSGTENLFLSFTNGHEIGFLHYYRLYYRPLRYFAIRLLKDEPLAEDVVEESFIKLFEKRATIQSEAGIKGFLYTTVRNACFDKLEQQKIRAAHHRQIEYLQAKESTSADAELIRTETLAIIINAIEQLPPATRKVFQLHYIEGMSYDEISKTLGRSKETIRKQKQQGLATLKGKLLFIALMVCSILFLLQQ